MLLKKMMVEGIMTPLNIKSIARDDLRGALGHVALRQASLLIQKFAELQCLPVWKCERPVFCVFCLYPQDLEK